MKTTICGIPCQIEYTITGDYRPAHINCEADYSYPAEYPDIEFDVLDRRGRPAPWLECKLTEAEIARIESEILGQQA